MTKSVVSIYDIGALGGAERYAAHLCEALLAEGHQVTLLTNGETAVEVIEKYFGLNLEGLRIRQVPAGIKNVPVALSRALVDLYKYFIVKVDRTDYYFECAYKSEMFGAAKNNFYICHFPHSLDMGFDKSWRKIYFSSIQKMRNILMGRGGVFIDTYDEILANSRFTQMYVKQRWGREASLLYPPCSLMEVPSLTSAKKKQIISVGRFEKLVPNIPHKGQHHLIRAFSELGDLHEQGWELHLVGSCRGSDSQSYLESLKKLAEGLPVYFHPNLEYGSLQNLLATSTLYWHAQGYGQDLAKHPETQEHFGITTVEAMSAACIPVVINSAGPKEVAEGYGGETWDSLEDLRDKTRFLASLPILELRKRQTEAVERAQYFSEKNFNTRIYKLLAQTSVD